MFIKMLLTLIIFCKLVYAMPPLEVALDTFGDLLLAHDWSSAHAVMPVAPQPGGLRRLFGRRLLGQ